MLKVAGLQTAGMDSRASLDEICRDGARRMLGAALEAEGDAYIEAFVDVVDEDDRRLVVRTLGRSTATLRPPSVTLPDSVPCQFAVRAGLCLPFGPATAVASAASIWPNTSRPIATDAANKPRCISCANVSK